MQPTSGFQYKRVSGTAAGTTVIKASYGQLKNIVIGQNKTGTIALYDHASGTSAASLLVNLDNTAGTTPVSINFDMRFRNGLVAEIGGTTDILVIYQ